MFFCNIHNWNSLHTWCPMCYPVTTASASTQPILDTPKEEQPKERITIKRVMSAHATDYDSLEPLVYIYPSRHLEVEEIRKIRKGLELILNDDAGEQTTKEGFVWTDELVNEFVNLRIHDGNPTAETGMLNHVNKMRVEQFKASKQSQSIPIKSSELFNANPAGTHVGYDKQPLFRTEDGVDIFEGDKYVSLSSDGFILEHTNGADVSMKYWNNDGSVKTFSTKKAAKSYADKQTQSNTPKYQYVDSNMNLHESDTPVSATVTVNIPKEQPSKDYEIMNFPEQPIYTQKQYDKAFEEGFNAARERKFIQNPSVIDITNNEFGFKYKTASDYLNNK